MTLSETRSAASFSVSNAWNKLVILELFSVQLSSYLTSSDDERYRRKGTPFPHPWRMWAFQVQLSERRVVYKSKGPEGFLQTFVHSWLKEETCENNRFKSHRTHLTDAIPHSKIFRYLRVDSTMCNHDYTITAIAITRAWVNSEETTFLMSSRLSRLQMDEFTLR